MKAFTHANPRDVTHALTLVREARQSGRAAAIAGGGSDLLGMMKERLVAPDLLVNLKAVRGLDEVTPQKGGGVLVGGLITLDALSRHPAIRRKDDFFRRRIRIRCCAGGDEQAAHSLLSAGGSISNRRWAALLQALPTLRSRSHPFGSLGSVLLPPIRTP